ncbi:DUF6364 family protein [Ekhidna sp.]|uniref:DUF6364 family protein n=1 Tax=Ekhidna sp. TaxID=2608089 RepID=UPI0032ED5CF5
MSTKLTLTIEEEVIEKTKKYAASTGSSLSKMVEDYFRSILAETETKKPSSKRIRKLKGIIAYDSDSDYKKVLEEGLIEKYDQ